MTDVFLACLGPILVGLGLLTVVVVISTVLAKRYDVARIISIGRVARSWGVPDALRNDQRDTLPMMHAAPARGPWPLPTVEMRRPLAPPPVPVDRIIWSVDYVPCPRPETRINVSGRMLA